MAVASAVEVTCLGLCPSSNCLLIDISNGPRILVDCPLEPHGLAHFPVDRAGGDSEGQHPAIPHGSDTAEGMFHTAQLGAVDPATVDCIIITNFHNMQALPYISRRALGFNGVVLATEPTAQIGLQLMLQLADHVASSPHCAPPAAPGAAVHKTQGSLLLGPGRRPFTRAEVEESFEPMVRLSYHQSHALLGGFSLTPCSSGYCLGAANWLVSSATLRVAMIGASSMHPSRHPLPLQLQNLQRVDVAIIGDLLPLHRTAAPSPQGGQPPQGAAWLLPDVVKGVAHTLLQGGNVLFPIDPCGVALDVIHALGVSLPAMGIATMQAKMFVVAPAAEGVIGYCEILAEWLNKSQAERVYLPESPFIHNDLIASGRLTIVADVHALGAVYREPCVVFAGHPSLRFGPVLHFLRRWGSNPANALVLADPYWNKVGMDNAWPIMQPHHPVQMRVMFAPLDTRLSSAQAAALLKQLAPAAAITPGAWLHPGEGSAGGPYLGCLSSAHAVLTERPVPAMMDVSLATEVRMRKVGKVTAGRVACLLQERDGRRRLVSASSAASEGGGVEHDLDSSQRLLYGSVNAVSLVAALERRGIRDVGTHTAGACSTVAIPSLGARVLIEPDKCHVITGITGAYPETSRDKASRNGAASPEKKPRPAGGPGGAENGSKEGNGSKDRDGGAGAGESAGARLLHEAILEQLEQL